MNESQILSACESASVLRPPEPNPPYHILVVDDDPGIRCFNTEVLTHCGYVVDTAVDGAAGWQALNDKSYDLMITDNNMPKLTGFALLQILRAAHMKLPVIMASGTFYPEEANSEAEVQPDVSLLKPYTMEALVEAVRKVLREPTSPAGVSPVVAVREQKDDQSAPTVASDRELRQSPSQTPHRILVVDEDPALRQMYIDLLAGSGYEVDSAKDGVAGWAALQSHQYQLLIAEHELPRLDGVALVRKLRAAHLDVPVVLTAAQWPTHELAHDPAVQLAAVLSKPFAWEVLLGTVRSVLRTTTSLRAAIGPDWQGERDSGGLQC